MEHADHSTPGAKRFGVNTNGLGILIVAVIAVCLALFCWDFWKDGSKETDLYRINTSRTRPENGEHEQGEKPGETPASSAGETVAPSSTLNVSAVDTATKVAAVDSSKLPAMDTTKANH